MSKHSGFSEAQLRALCDTLGHTNNGLTNSEIGKYLKLAEISDLPEPPPGFYNSVTKRDRLFSTLGQAQNQANTGGPVVRFIHAVMNPIHYQQKPDEYEYRRELINGTLAHCGLYVGKNGKLHKVLAATTISEAERRARGLKSALIARQVHADILAFCKAELLEENYFHAVLETSKSLLHKIRQRTGITLDGIKLIDAVFENGNRGFPLLAFNKLQSDTERNEHRGLTNLLRGVVSAFRNSTAHEPKVNWAIEELEALDIMSLASLLHRRLDNAFFTGTIEV